MSYSNDLLQKERKDFSAKILPASNKNERAQVIDAGAPLPFTLVGHVVHKHSKHSPSRAKYHCTSGCNFLSTREEKLIPSGLHFAMPQEWKYFPLAFLGPVKV
jgi:hypothetical protein